MSNFVVSSAIRASGCCGAGGPNLQCLLHHQTPWHRHGTSHKPIHCGIGMAAACGLPTTLPRAKFYFTLPIAARRSRLRRA